MADGVVFLPSFHEAIKDLPDAERLGIYDAITRYGLYGEIIEMTPGVKSLFALIKPVIDSSQRRYRQAKTNGSMPPKDPNRPRGRPLKNQTENQRKNQTRDQTRNQDTEIEKDIDSDIEKELDFDTDSDSDSDREGESVSEGEETTHTRGPYKQPSEQEFEKMRQAALAKLYEPIQKTNETL